MPEGTSPIKLNLGAGDLPLPEYINIDRKTGGEAFPLSEDGLCPRKSESAEEVRASHVLEHFPAAQAIDVLKEWVRVLRPGGVLKVAVPNFDKIIGAVNAGNPNAWPIQGYIYGGQTDENDYHKSGYNEEWLRHLLALAGLVDIRPWTSEIQDCAALPISLNLQGTKPIEIPAMSRPFPSHRRIAAVMSMPRLAFATNMFSALQAFVPLQIPFEKVEGAWWCQCMERVMTPHLTDGTEFIITLDYDAAFRIEHVHQICALMEDHPEADAIVPIQFKRAELSHLFRPIDPTTGEYRTGTMSMEEFEPPLVPIGWGHFALSVFRVESLKKMSHPWFQARTAPDGTWGDGRTDADIAFWEKFRKAGNKVFLATHVSIGHLELMASMADHNLQRFHVHAEDLQRKWPENARK